MRIWFDTEFIDDGRTIDLISIGMVREDGRELYRESAEVDLPRGDKWLRENVYPHLSLSRMARYDIAREILEFAGSEPEFWADYAAYDWVVLCQLYGRMIDIPEGWPWYCLDVRHLRHKFGKDPISLPPFIGTEHFALDDARHCRRLWEHLTREA